MAKIVKRSSFFKRKKKWEHFKLKLKKWVMKASLMGNMALYAHDFHEKQVSNLYEIAKKVVETYLT